MRKKNYYIPVTETTEVQLLGVVMVESKDPTSQTTPAWGGAPQRTDVF